LKTFLNAINTELKITQTQDGVPMHEQVYPEPTVGVFILNPKNELLLLISHKWPEQYVVPGGHIELGESLLEAAKREALEETGLYIYDVEFVCFQEFIYDPSFWKPRHFIFFDFFCKADSLSVSLNDEAESYSWVPLTNTLNLPIDRYTKFTIEKYINS
jgi:nucleoside triphosphatase